MLKKGGCGTAQSTFAGYVHRGGDFQGPLRFDFEYKETPDVHQL